MSVLLSLALAVAAPPPAMQPTPVNQARPVDPARLAVAKRVVARIWPTGTFRRMMDGSLDRIVQGSMASMYGMKASDFAAMAGTAPKATDDKTIADLMAERDPHFRERMDIILKVTLNEVTELVTKVEPQVQDALARSYARRFTAEQLGEIDRFFTTPAGGAFAAQSMTIYTDPDMMAAMQSMTPEIIKAMPGIMKKVQQATAHLPPPPKPAAPANKGQ